MRADRRSRAATATLVALTLGAVAARPAGALELTGWVGIDSRLFFEDPALEGQRRESGAFSPVIRPEVYHSWNDGASAVLFVPFLRIDLDDPERTHGDIRELNYLHVGDDWELRLGLAKVFWGVTESQHLVDIVNQTDLVEDPDTEDKLGQPMVHLTLIRDFGTFDLFALPGFRERTFPGEKGRLRFDPAVDTDRAEYESSLEQAHVDAAARWSHYVGDFDLALSYFWGTSREPGFRFDVDPSGQPALIPVYELIHQGGLEGQWTTDAWLFKLEGIVRAGQGRTFVAMTGGFEYTFYGVFDSGADLGLLAEYLFDDRGTGAPPTPFENDVFLGARLALNDVQSLEVLGGALVDLETGAQFWNLEASRRIGERFTLELETRIFAGVPQDALLASVRDDDYVQLRLAYYL